MSQRMEKTEDARNSSDGIGEVASLCFGCTETTCNPLPEIVGAASRWSIQYKQ
ncbi:MULTISPECIES: hypothetical protein [Bacteroidaceae]|jgi:hypothetical protein|uniref:hypothetical protein n=1 Tax=Bacteroidaceae TaxID=815 RepID=UPI00192B48D5|nr:MULTISPECIES: hypothetical protein [Bacteroidaceae]MCR1857238.1 hypothetical protein [Phocaeicola vulgatus]QQY42335.1 hypothetical protein I6I56_21620 [Phocaeicola vulgatus]